MTRAEKENSIKLWIKRFDWKLINIGTFRVGMRIQFYNWKDYGYMKIKSKEQL